MQGCFFLINSGYSAVRVDFNSPSSVGKLIFISDLTVGEIKILRRDSVGFHHLFCKLTIRINTHTDVFRSGSLGLSCEADIGNAALRILYTPEIDNDITTLKFGKHYCLSIAMGDRNFRGLIAHLKRNILHGNG